MKKKISTIVLLLLVIGMITCMFTGCAKKGENILTTAENGAFVYDSIESLSEDFTLVCSSSVETDTVFSYDESDTEGQYVIGIDTTSTSCQGYASLQQKVHLNAGCYYTVTYDVVINSMAVYSTNDSYDGVFFTILEDEDFNYTDTKADYHQKTVTSGETCSYSFLSKDTQDVTVALCVGTEEYPVKALVEVESFKLERVSKANAVDNNEQGSDINTFATDYYGGVKLFNMFYIIAGGLLIIALSVVAYVMLRRHFALSSDEEIALDRGYNNAFLKKLNSDKKIGILLFAGIGLLIRLIVDICSSAISSSFIHTTMGFNLEGLTAQAIFISKYGPANLIASLGGEFATDFGYTVMKVSSSPLQLYFLGFAGLFGRIFEGINSTAGYYATMFFIRFFLSLADVATAYFIYDLVKKNAGNIGAVVTATLYLVLPTVFAVSSLWGYMESVTALLIVLTFRFMLKNNYLATAITYFVACMFSQVALFVAPVVLFYTVLVCIKDCKKEEYRTLISACAILVLSFFVYYALTAPFDINFIQDGTPFYCFKASWQELYTNAVYTVNAFNFQAMLGNNDIAVTTASLVVTIIFIVFMLTLVGFAYFKFKNRMNLMLLATAFINMMYVFANDMKPVSMFISLALMLIYAVMNKEKRIFFSFVCFAVLTFVNISYCELFLAYTTNSIGYFYKDAVMYVFASLNLLVVLYYIYIVYDIVASRKVRKMTPLNMTVSKSVRNIFLRMEKKFLMLKEKSSK